MAWSLQGQFIESCSCAMLCPCYFGAEGRPDQGWCSGAIGLNITRGQSDGVDLSNTRAVFAADFPGNFGLGDGTVRWYLDEGLKPDQRRALEQILTGQQGGTTAALAAAMSKTLPSKTARISFGTKESPTISVAGVGEVRLSPMKDQNGANANVSNAPTLTAFGIASSDLANTEGEWKDPDLRSWKPGGSGSLSEFRWSA